MTLSRILSIVFLISALALGYFLYKSVDDVMQQEKLIIATEARIIEKLQMLRDAQVAYLASNGVYAGNWNDLKKFIEEGKIWLVQRTETTKLLEYGKEEISVQYDTLGSVEVIDSLFNERKYPNFNIDNMHIVPGSGGKQFEFFADKVERTQREIPVFEIRDPDPINPKRRLNNKEKALRVGSRTDSSTSGNWE
ncbi:hypothetical protein [Aquiflexum gelatinilyticum]|jgi:hypothetical protein|uniref:Uncharacterized protein n=1 Tax=Aquiflexum gelatinilyticum TaxID=2961943 RepID=A0A9X2P1S3_9BACT|nr:hypothetical protein [Aquiflexum gelatinilyticum]MCR9014064.1 hypothetical protein [Aquiflexum gelatinilyticum]MCS4433241.1 hypothetical protein [Aquiflexum gelatinilyticum]